MAVKIKTIIAVLSALALLATGTFAFNQIIRQTNEFMGQKDGVTLHDDFNPGDGKKDVYVENQGSNAMYIRIKLNEAMDLTSYTWRPSSSDWKTHKYAASAVDCRNSNAAGKLFHDYFTWEMGGSKWYMPSDGTRPLVQDTTDYTGVAGAKQTPNAAIISAAAFLAMSEQEQKDFIGWILASDGYAYWSQPLKSGDATGLLLKKVLTNPNLKNTNYYYAIDVIMEASDLEDTKLWKDEPGATTDGKEVIDIITKQNPDPVVNVEVTILNGDMQLLVDDVFKLSYKVEPADYANGKQLTWSSSNAAAAIVAADGTVTALAKGVTTISITIGDYSDSIVVTVVEDELIVGDDDADADADTDTDTDTDDDNDTGLEVKPADPAKGYSPRPGEGAWFTGYDWDVTPTRGEILDRKGAIRLEDILVSTDYTGLTVTPLDSKYNGLFEIDVIGPSFNNAPSILFSYVPDRDTAKPLWLADKGTNFPFTTMLRLEQNGKSVEIKVTMEYSKTLVAFE